MDRLFRHGEWQARGPRVLSFIGRGCLRVLTLHCMELGVLVKGLEWVSPYVSQHNGHVYIKGEGG